MNTTTTPDVPRIVLITSALVGPFFIAVWQFSRHMEYMWNINGLLTKLIVISIMVGLSVEIVWVPMSIVRMTKFKQLRTIQNTLSVLIGILFIICILTFWMISKFF